MGNYTNMSRETERQILTSAKKLNIYPKIFILLYIYQARYKTTLTKIVKSKPFSKSELYATVNQLLDAGLINRNKSQYFMFNEQKISIDYLFLSLCKFCTYKESQGLKPSNNYIEAK